MMFSAHVSLKYLTGTLRSNKNVFDDMMTWRLSPHYWPFARGIYRSPVDPHLKRTAMKNYKGVLLDYTRFWTKSRVVGCSVELLKCSCDDTITWNISSITVPSWWAWWRLKSPASRLFTQSLFRPRSKKTSKLRVNGLCAGNSPVTGEFPAQRASNADNVSIWWRHHGFCCQVLGCEDISIVLGSEKLHPEALPFSIRGINIVLNRDETLSSCDDNYEPCISLRWTVTQSCDDYQTYWLHWTTPDLYKVTLGYGKMKALIIRDYVALRKYYDETYDMTSYDMIYMYMIYVHMHMHVHVHIKHIHIHMHMHMHMHIHIYTYTYTHTHAHVHAHAYAHSHAHRHTLTHRAKYTWQESI